MPYGFPGSNPGPGTLARVVHGPPAMTGTVGQAEQPATTCRDRSMVERILGKNEGLGPIPSLGSMLAGN